MSEAHTWHLPSSCTAGLEPDVHVEVNRSHDVSFRERGIALCHRAQGIFPQDITPQGDTVASLLVSALQCAISKIESPVNLNVFTTMLSPLDRVSNPEHMNTLYTGSMYAVQLVPSPACVSSCSCGPVVGIALASGTAVWLEQPNGLGRSLSRNLQGLGSEVPHQWRRQCKMKSPRQLKWRKPLQRPLLQHHAQIVGRRWQRLRRGTVSIWAILQAACLCSSIVICVLRCRRAAHFATFRTEDDEETGAANVHVGGDEVRSSCWLC